MGDKGQWHGPGVKGCLSQPVGNWAHLQHGEQLAVGLGLPQQELGEGVVVRRRARDVVQDGRRQRDLREEREPASVLKASLQVGQQKHVHRAGR